jgi:ribosomal 50S subunit-recycling heat shock protein
LSKEVKVGNINEIIYGTRVMNIKVTDIKKQVRKNDAAERSGYGKSNRLLQKEK